MFICLLSLLRTHFPSVNEFKRYGLIRKKDINSVPKKRRLAASKVLSKFAPTSQLSNSTLLRSSSYGSNLCAASADCKDDECPKSKFATGELAKPTTGISAIRCANAKQDSVDVTKSPSSFLSKGRTEDQLLFCQCGRQIADFDVLLCDCCKKLQSELKLEGYLLVKDGGTKKAKRLWYVIERQVMYCYAGKSDKTYKSMRNLAGCFFKEESPEKIEGKTVGYPFSLFFSNEISRKFYCQTKEDLTAWSDVIKQSIGYYNVTDFYTIKVSSLMNYRKRWGRGSLEQCKSPFTKRRRRELQ
eukprot:TRINITY_DN13405_c0_g1_i1.p1 TRINITY_DN13405_c0_g1~~TRINITY_DN13405_c0_g1_i1.p1  ORF type:complete len:300 (+),score=70.45 TRINITY_DN13405_c0_g1_i1:918-1817(+)